MILTNVHAEYWRQRRATPAWAASLLPMVRVDIDSVVNAHAGPRPRLDNEAHNLMGILRMVRKRLGKQPLAVARVNSLEEYLLGLTDAYACVTGPVPKRTALARKWAARIKRGK